MMRILPVLCILLGTVIFLYPTVNSRYESFKQQRIMQQWTDNLRQIDMPEDTIDSAETAGAAESAAVASPPTSNTEAGAPEVTHAAAAKQEPEVSQPVLLQQAPVEGVLIIDKINLKLPILTDATVDHLNVSISSIANTGRAGAVGNYAIAGHRNLQYGKNFNRLDELAEGDMVEVDTGKQQYWYRVEKKLYVLPQDIWVLEGNGKDKELTLITCHPIKNATHRLIVKGKLVEKP